MNSLAAQLQVTSVVVNRPSVTTNPCGDQLFGTFLIEAVDKTMMELLGAKASEALWFRMNEEMFMVKNDIPQHVHKLVIFLENTMGAKPSRTVERHILRRLYAALQHQSPESLEFDFQVEVEKARVLSDERQKLRQLHTDYFEV